jgi:hypothetical protein
MSWTSLVPSGAGLSMAIRFGDTPTPDGTWTPFGSVVSSGGPVTGTSRYVQYRATFSANGQVTPELSAVTVSPAGAVSLSITNSSITEGNSGVTMASFVVSLPSPSSQTITVSYTTTPGTASNGSDYITTAGDLTFSPGVTQQTIEVPVVGDLLDESNETFTVDLSDAVNANIDDSQGVATINDDDSAPSMSIADITVTEGNSGTVNAIFVVTLSSESGQAVTVNYATADSTAVGGQDYTTASGTLTFPAGSTSQSITVAVLGDTAVENNETFVVNLSGAVNATVADAQGLGTVTTDDTALAIGDVTVTEGNGTTVNATFTVTRTGLTTQATTVDFATANGTATAGLDYSAASGTLTFASGVTTQTITVSTLGDTLDEANETFFVNLNNAAGAAIADNQAIGTITDNDGTPSLTINNATVTEGNAGTVTATFTVTLSVASGQTATVNYATANGTASGSDYSATSGTLSFGPDETTKTVNVTVSGDTTVEANETFFVNLTNGVNATIADSQGLGTITNDDASLVINNVSVVEGHTGTVNANFTVTLSGLTTQTVTVNYATANGTATAGEDYTATSGTLTFAPGETTKPVAVAVLGDTVNESGQTFFVNLTNGVNAVIADTQGQGTITNDDTGLVINNVTAAEGNTGATTNATFTVTRSGVTTGTTTVDFANADGTALAGQDYTSVSGTLTFAAGVTTQTIVVPVRGDLLDEANETYFVNLSNAVGATITDNQGLGTINDNDATPSLVINNVPVTEGNAGSVNATFTVTLSAASGRVVTVNYLTDTTTGTATAGQDYTLTTGTLTFPLGTTTQTITVPVLGDTLDEANETYFVRLSAASNASLADSQGNGTITDDDPTPSLVIDNVSLTEGNAGTTTFTFTVTLSAASGRNVTVNYTTANGTASSASDYTARSGTLTFAPGVTSQTVSVLVTGDATTEANETFVVNLSGASNATIADNQGLGTITNDD